MSRLCRCVARCIDLPRITTLSTPCSGRGFGSRTLTHYLEHFAEPRPGPLETIPAAQHAVVIPCAGEGTGLLRTLETIPPSVLVIVILNAPEDGPDFIERGNRQTLHALDSHWPKTALGGELSFYSRGEGGILVVNRCCGHRRLPRRQGVGLARKLGGDLLLHLQELGVVSERLIRFTDADALLPAGYFSEPIVEDAAAYVFPFRHELDVTGPGHAILAYEIALRYYVLGLRYAGSPYAFHSVGSTMVLDRESYAAVRGVPKRNAAEDFYLLNKVAKVGKLRCLDSEPLKLSGRVSARVPFGTGAAMMKARAHGIDALDWPLYDPRIFEVLRVVFEAIAAATDAPHDFDERFRFTLSERLKTDSSVVFQLIRAGGLLEVIGDALGKTRTPSHARRRIHGWFDGFRTMKLIHNFRDALWPSVGLAEALGRAEFFPGPVSSDIEQLADDLYAAEIRQLPRRVGSDSS